MHFGGWEGTRGVRNVVVLEEDGSGSVQTVGFGGIFNEMQMV